MNLVLDSNWWVAIGTTAGVLVSSMIAIASLVKTSKERHADNERQNSEFYLLQAKAYFTDAVDILEKAGNTNIKWHQAIDLLKNSDTLKKQLTELPHKNIYVLDYINAGYRLINLIIKIDDSKFFYGVEDYANLDSKQLQQKIRTQGLGCYRISPDSLLWLCNFITKATKARHAYQEKHEALEKIFDEAYFQKNVDERYGIVSDILKVILSYIDEYERNAAK